MGATYLKTAQDLPLRNVVADFTPRWIQEVGITSWCRPAPPALASRFTDDLYRLPDGRFISFIKAKNLWLDDNGNVVSSGLTLNTFGCDVQVEGETAPGQNHALIRLELAYNTGYSAGYEGKEHLLAWMNDQAEVQKRLASRATTNAEIAVTRQGFDRGLAERRATAAEREAEEIRRQTTDGGTHIQPPPGTTPQPPPETTPPETGTAKSIGWNIVDYALLAGAAGGLYLLGRIYFKRRHHKSRARSR